MKKHEFMNNNVTFETQTERPYNQRIEIFLDCLARVFEIHDVKSIKSGKSEIELIGDKIRFKDFEVEFK